MKKHELEEQLRAIKLYAQHIKSIEINPNYIVVVKYHAKTDPKALRGMIENLMEYVKPMKVIAIPDKIELKVLNKQVFTAYWYKVKEEVGI